MCQMRRGHVGDAKVKTEGWSEKDFKCSGPKHAGGCMACIDSELSDIAYRG